MAFFHKDLITSLCDPEFFNHLGMRRRVSDGFGVCIYLC